MADWLVAARTATEPAALVTVLATEGSAPREAGTRMTVTADAVHGTIGGGALEWQATAQARAALAHPAGTWRVQDYPLGPLLGQCCGGRVRLLVERLAATDWLDRMAAGELLVATLGDGGIERRAGSPAPPIAARGPLPVSGDAFTEPLDTPRRPLMLFGAGHVGQAIARMLPGLPLDLAWFDSRPDFDLPGLVIQPEDALPGCTADAKADTAVLVMTHDHGLDYRLVAAALGSPARFVGLIGSATKRARFAARLAADGIDGARLTCPIGGSAIPGKEPAVIAVAALAQILALGPPA